MKVYSFVAANIVEGFSADAKEFFNYLQNNHGFPVSSQYLISKLTL
jgi:xyloglucan-specific endo-beta-1,4-glucanase